jgi:hypothetical protein
MLGRRKPQKQGKQLGSGELLAKGEQMREALEKLRQRQEKVRRKHRGKQRHIDDYRELVLRKADPGELPRAMLDLTQQSYADRKRLLPDEPTRLVLPARPGAAAGPEGARREAERAAREMKREMERQGRPEPTHYYTYRERLETGEIDRTYKIPGRSGNQERPRSRPRR